MDRLIKIDDKIILDPDTVDRIVHNDGTGKTVIHTKDDFFFITNKSINEVWELLKGGK